MKEALESLGNDLRLGFKALGAALEEDLPQADREAAYVTFGWDGGLLGNMKSPSRVEALANLAVEGDALVHPAACYPAAVQSRIVTALAVLNANQPLANTGNRSAAIEARNAARDELQIHIGRVRHYYCCASDLGDQTPQLRRIGLQPRRDAGEAQPQPLPDEITTAAYDLETDLFSMAELPDHATSARAFLQPEGGEKVQFAVTSGTSVKVGDFVQLLPGVKYILTWKGRNSRGDGPESNGVEVTGT